VTSTPPGPPDADGPGAPAPVCPRHPDRESYVRCQRCEQPVCVQCQRAAAVGVQCVDCAAEGARRVRGATTVFGGRPTDGRPLVTQVVIGLCVVVFLLQQVLGSAFTNALAFTPFYALEQPWRFVTGSFLHASGTFGIPHLLLNMYALWVLGPELERVLGRARFAALYLVSAVAGNVGVTVLTEHLVLVPGGLATTGAVGASGAVFGLFGALLVVSRRMRLPLAPVMGVLVINLAFGFFVAGISWQAHVGGLLGGLAVGAVMAYAPRERRTLLQVLGVLAVVVLLAGAAALGFSLQPSF
jgi:membrane associated rhomboid family serine protease